MEKRSLESLLAEGLSIERIGKLFEKHPSTVSYWMKKYGLDANNRERHAPKGGVARDRLEALVEADMTTAEIATELNLSKTTVRHWMARYGLRTRNKGGPQARSRVARREGSWTEKGRDVVSAPRRDRIRHRGEGLLPLQAVPGRQSHAEPAESEADAGRGGGREVRCVRL